MNAVIPRSNSIIFLWLSYLMAIGCSPGDNNESKREIKARIEFNLEESNQIQLPFEYTAGFNLTCQAYSRSDTDFVLLGDLTNGKLIELDITHNQFVRVISLDRIRNGRYPVFSHHYKNEDTIVILPDISNQRGLYHDSFLYSVSLKGEEHQTYNLVGSPFIMDGMERDSTRATLFHHFSPMLVYGNKFFVHPLPLKSGMNRKDANRHHIPELGYFTLSGTESLKFKGIPYQRALEHDMLPYAHEQERLRMCIRDVHTLMVSHASLPNIHIVDIQTGEYTTSDERGRLIPDPIPLPSSGKQPQYNVFSTVFHNLLFDSQQKLTYRFATLPSSVDLKPGDRSLFREKVVWVGAYDESMKLVAQALKPDWFKLHPEPTFFKGRFISISQGEDLTQLSIQFTELDTVGMSQGEYDALRTQLGNIQPNVTEENINTLYTRLGIPANSVVLAVPSHSCPYCLNYVTQYFLMNLDRMQDEHIYFVTSAEGASQELLAIESPNIIVDERDELEDLLDQSINNPTLMIWDGSAVTQSLVLSPDEVKIISAHLEEFQKALTD